MSELKRHFERLMEFAKECNFHKSFSQVYFVEEQSIRHFYDFDKVGEISLQDIFTLENYENRFNELLNQGHCWIHMNFAGMLDDTLLITIRFPNYQNNSKFTAVNFSGPFKRVADNDWNLNSYIKII